MRPSGACTGQASSADDTYQSQVSRACSGGSCSSSRRCSASAPGHCVMSSISSGSPRSIAASVMPAPLGVVGAA